MGFGFGFDLHNYLHESPAVPFIVHVHAMMATLWLLIVTALVLLVEFDNVKLHRRLGWFAAYVAVLMVVLPPWAQVAWQAVNLHTPGALPPEFLSIAFSGVLCFAILFPWGVMLRSNTAAHRRVMILSTIAMADAGFARMLGLFVPAQTTWLGQYFFYYGGAWTIMLSMFLWDWYKGRVMRQFLVGAGLIVAVEVVANTLFFNAGWQAFARHWVGALARRS